MLCSISVASSMLASLPSCSRRSVLWSLRSAVVDIVGSVPVVGIVVGCTIGSRLRHRPQHVRVVELVLRLSSVVGVRSAPASWACVVLRISGRGAPGLDGLVSSVQVCGRTACGCPERIFGAVRCTPRIGICVGCVASAVDRWSVVFASLVHVLGQFAFVLLPDWIPV